MSDDLMAKPSRIASGLAKLIEVVFERISNISAVFEEDAKVYQTRRDRLAYSYRIRRIAIFRSAVIGGIASSIPILLIYNFILPIFPQLDSSKGEISGFESFILLMIIIVISVIITIVELFFLYLDTVRYAGKLNIATQRKIDTESEVDRVISERLPLGLTRAAIGLSKDRTPNYGVDPMENTSKITVAARGVAFQAQAFVVNLIVKRLLRRVGVRTFGRSAPRALAEWLLVPIYMIWNVVGTVKIMNELIYRANGLELTEHMVEELSLDEKSIAKLEPHLKLGLRNQIFRSKAIHPNIEFLILKLGFENLHCDDDVNFNELSEGQKKTIGKFLCFLPILEGKRRKAHRDNNQLALEILGEEEIKRYKSSLKKYAFKGIAA